MNETIGEYEIKRNGNESRKEYKLLHSLLDLNKDNSQKLTITENP